MLNPGQEPDHVRGNTSQHVESEAQFDVECPHEISNWSLDLKHLKRSLVVPLQQIFAHPTFANTQACLQDGDALLLCLVQPLWP